MAAERPARRARPAEYALRVVGRVAPNARPRLQKAFIKRMYEQVNRKYSLELNFMNYGYASLDTVSPSPATSEPYSLQLYERVASACDLTGAAVLEVGCGRGGGSAYLARELGPGSVTGIDLSPTAVATATARHRDRGLRFLSADAEHIPFRAASFDAVVNVESSHCYPDFGRFLREVWMVLRPGGWLLLADLRMAEELALTVEQCRAAGFTVREEESIRPNVVRALELDGDRRLAFLHGVPRLLRPAARDFVAVEGSDILNRLRTGRLDYVRLALEKPGA